MKVIDLMVKGIIKDLVSDDIEIYPGTNLRKELYLSDKSLTVIWQRLQLIFDIRIPKELFISKTTYGELCEHVLSIFNQYENLKKFNTNP